MLGRNLDNMTFGLHRIIKHHFKNMIFQVTHATDKVDDVSTFVMTNYHIDISKLHQTNEKETSDQINQLKQS